MHVVDIFALLIPFNLQDLFHVFSRDHPLQKLEQYYKRDNNSTLTPTYASTPVNSRTVSYSTPYSLPFDQDSAIIIFQAQNKLNEFLKVELLFVAAGVKSQEQSILNHYTKNMGVTIAQYKLDNNSDLLKTPSYPAHDFVWLDFLPIQKIEDEDFIDNFRNVSYTRRILLFDRYL